jgi:hypothetical protein
VQEFQESLLVKVSQIKVIEVVMLIPEKLPEVMEELDMSAGSRDRHPQVVLT